MNNASRASSATITGDDPPLIRGIRRQREIDDDQLQEIAPPPKRPKEIVDLTEDK